MLEILAAMKLNIRELPGPSDVNGNRSAYIIGLSYSYHLDIPIMLDRTVDTHYIENEDGDVIFIGSLHECGYFLEETQDQIDEWAHFTYGPDAQAKL